MRRIAIGLFLILVVTALGQDVFAGKPAPLRRSAIPTGATWYCFIVGEVGACTRDMDECNKVLGAVVDAQRYLGASGQVAQRCTTQSEAWAITTYDKKQKEWLADIAPTQATCETYSIVLATNEYKSTSSCERLRSPVRSTKKVR